MRQIGMLLLVGVVVLASVPWSATAHEAVNVISRDRVYNSHLGAAVAAQVYQCDALYRLGGNPESGTNTFCVGQALTDAHATSSFPGVVLTTDHNISVSYDCRFNINNPQTAGSATGKMHHGGIESTCAYSYSTGTVANQVDEDLHWVKTHDAADPTLFYYTNFNLTMSSSVGAKMASLNWTQYAYYAFLLSGPQAYLKDNDKDDTYYNVASDIFTWKVKDPGADDRLYVGIVDVTPAVGGTVIVEPSVSATRSDGGNGDVIWVFESTLSSKRLAVSAADDSRGYYKWDLWVLLS